MTGLSLLTLTPITITAWHSPYRWGWILFTLGGCTLIFFEFRKQEKRRIAGKELVTLIEARKEKRSRTFLTISLSTAIGFGVFLKGPWEKIDTLGVMVIAVALFLIILSFGNLSLRAAEEEGAMERTRR